MSRFPKFLFFFLSIFILFFNCGCTPIRNFQKGQQQKKENAVIKKNNYLALRRDIATNSLQNGTKTENLKEKYGAPDDVFYSSSSVSSFQIWTYNATTDKLSDTALSTILLYLENDKLVNWKY